MDDNKPALVSVADIPLAVVHIDIQCTGLLEFGPWRNNDIYELGMRVCYLKTPQYSIRNVEQMRATKGLVVDAHYFFLPDRELIPEVRLRCSLDREYIRSHNDLTIARPIDLIRDFVKGLGNVRVVMVTQNPCFVRELLLVQWRNAYGREADGTFLSWGWVNLHLYMKKHFEEIGRVHVDGAYVYRSLASAWMAALQNGSAALYTEEQLDPETSWQNISTFSSMLVLYAKNSAAPEFCLDAIDDPAVVYKLGAQTKLVSLFGVTINQVISVAKFAMEVLAPAENALFKQYVVPPRLFTLSHLLVFARAFLMSKKHVVAEGDVRTEFKYVFRSIQFLLRSAGIFHDAILVEAMAGAVDRPDSKLAIYERYFNLFKSGCLQYSPLEMKDAAADALREIGIKTVGDLYVRYMMADFTGHEASVEEVISKRENFMEYLLRTVMCMNKTGGASFKEEIRTNVIMKMAYCKKPGT